jgi:hypothetical protein
MVVPSFRVELERRNGNYDEKSEHNGQTCCLLVPQKHFGKEHNYHNFYSFKETL